MIRKSWQDVNKKLFQATSAVTQQQNSPIAQANSNSDPHSAKMGNYFYKVCVFLSITRTSQNLITTFESIACASRLTACNFHQKRSEIWKQLKFSLLEKNHIKHIHVSWFSGHQLPRGLMGKEMIAFRMTDAQQTRKNRFAVERLISWMRRGNPLPRHEALT